MSAPAKPDQDGVVALVDVLGEFLNAPPAKAAGPQPSRHALIRAAEVCLRGIGQVVFMNHPLCGALILAGMAVQSWWLALFTIIGVAAGTVWACWTIDDRSGIDAGIYGYNGALVGAAAATFGQIDSPGSALAWGACTVLFAAASSALLHRMGGWLVKRGLPSLTLPFCFSTLACFVLVAALGLPGLSLAPAATESAQSSAVGLAALLEGAVPVGFGQIFFVGHILGGALVLAGVLVASPLGAAIGLLGGLAGLAAGALVGAPDSHLAAGLASYNGILCALALGGVFFACSLRTMIIGLVAAFVSTLVGLLLAAALAPLGLPGLTLSFCLVTLSVIFFVQHRLPLLVPVAMHAIHSPQEHRRRYRVAVDLLKDFRANLQASLEPGAARRLALKGRADVAVLRELEGLFSRLDRDGDGRLSLVDLASGLREFQQSDVTGTDWSDAVATAERRLDLLESTERLLLSANPQADGQIGVDEFSEVMLRCRRLLRDRDRLLTYLQPISSDAMRAIGRSDLDRLLVSLGQSPLDERDWQAIVRLSGGRALSWGELVDLMLIT
jgi:urea transporter